MKSAIPLKLCYSCN